MLFFFFILTSGPDTFYISTHLEIKQKKLRICKNVCQRLVFCESGGPRRVRKKNKSISRRLSNQLRRSLLFILILEPTGKRLSEPLPTYLGLVPKFLHRMIRTEYRIQQRISNHRIWDSMVDPRPEEENFFLISFFLRWRIPGFITGLISG